MKCLKILIIILFIFTPLHAKATAKTRSHLCGDVTTLPPTPLGKAPFQFLADSDSQEVYLLHSPDKRYIVVLRRGACDSTHMGIWDDVKKRPYGNETVSGRYETRGVCWDPGGKPVVYFFNESEAGYAEGAGIYKWEFEKHPDKPIQLDSSTLVKKFFKQDSTAADLLAVDKNAQHLLIEVSTADNSKDVEGRLIQNINKLKWLALSRAFLI